MNYSQPVVLIDRSRKLDGAMKALGLSGDSVDFYASGVRYCEQWMIPLTVEFNEDKAISLAREMDLEYIDIVDSARHLYTVEVPTGDTASFGKLQSIREEDVGHYMHAVRYNGRFFSTALLEDK